MRCRRQKKGTLKRKPSGSGKNEYMILMQDEKIIWKHLEHMGNALRWGTTFPLPALLI